MKESESLRREAERIYWRLQILQGKHGEKALKRLYKLVEHGYPERFCT